MSNTFMLLTEDLDGKVQVMNTGRGKNVIATEENKHLLSVVGNELLKDHLIAAHQLIQIAGPVVRIYDPTVSVPKRPSDDEMPS